MVELVSEDPLTFDELLAVFQDAEDSAKDLFEMIRTAKIRVLIALSALVTPPVVEP